MLRFSTCP